MGEFAEKLEQNMALKKNKNALERIDEVEKKLKEVEDSLPKILQAVNQVLTKLNTDVMGNRGALEALLSLTGKQVAASEEAIDKLVTAKIDELRLQKIEEHVKSQKDALYSALTDGTIREVDLVHEKCVLTGSEMDKDGKPAGTGYVQIPFDQFVPEVRDQFLGQAKGYHMTTSTGGSFTLEGIYEVVEKPEVAPTQEELTNVLAEVEKDVVEST